MSGMLPAAGAPNGSGADGAALPDADGERGNGSAPGTDQLGDMPEVQSIPRPDNIHSECEPELHFPIMHGPARPGLPQQHEGPKLPHGGHESRPVVTGSSGRVLSAACSCKRSYRAADGSATPGASCVQAVELCRMLAELEGVRDAVPSSRLQSAASSPSIQVRPEGLILRVYGICCSRVAMQPRVVLALGREPHATARNLRCSWQARFPRNHEALKGRLGGPVCRCCWQWSLPSPQT